MAAIIMELHVSARYWKQIFYHHLSPEEGQEKCCGWEGVDYMKDYTLKNTHARPVYSCTLYWRNISVEFVCNADKIASGTTGSALIFAPQNLQVSLSCHRLQHSPSVFSTRDKHQSQLIRDRQLYTLIVDMLVMLEHSSHGYRLSVQNWERILQEVSQVVILRKLLLEQGDPHLLHPQLKSEPRHQVTDVYAQPELKANEDFYSLFNLERILLASFLMSAIKSSSSAFVSGRRGERRLEGPGLCAAVNLPFPQTRPATETGSIRTRSEWVQVSATTATNILSASLQRCTVDSSSQVEF